MPVYKVCRMLYSLLFSDTMVLVFTVTDRVWMSFTFSNADIALCKMSIVKHKAFGKNWS